MKPEYKVIDSLVKIHFERLVSEAMADRWEPVGGVFYQTNNGTYHQAMVRFPGSSYTEEPPVRSAPVPNQHDVSYPTQPYV